MSRPQTLDRRQSLRLMASSVATPPLLNSLSRETRADEKAVKPKSVAAIITAYQRGLHADVLVGKILEGWEQDGGPGPALKLASMYVEQFPAKDMARPMSKKYDVPIFDSIEGAVTVGTKGVPVDGVISIGEHGNYPWNEKQQHLYPRRRFFAGITKTFEKYGRVVPVFNDKHIGPVWEDAKWMYDEARRMKIPFMAGSSLPFTYRKPDLQLPMDSEIESAVGVGYSGLDIYGSHTLAGYQCLVERRRGGETGVESVQCLEGDAMWDEVERSVPADLLAAVLDVLPKHSKAKLKGGGSLFVFQYRDGFRGRVLMLPHYVGGIGAAVKLKGESKPVATRFEERHTPYYPHFAFLLKSIERFFHSGRPQIPIERNLLTSGILDRALTSRFEDYRKLSTPELGIEYKPLFYPHAPAPKLDSHPLATL